MIGTLPFLAILLSAFLHASWNAIARSRPNPGDILACAVIASGVVSLPPLIYTGLPSPEAMPWLVFGVVINSIGIRAAMAAYARASFGLVYPVMRAGIPLLALPIAIALLGEWPSPGGVVGVLLISGALILLAFVASRAGKVEMTGVFYALFAALCGAGYVAADAMGVRLSADPLAYAFAVAVGNGLTLTAMVRFEGQNPVKLLIRNARVAFGVSALSMTSFILYVLALKVTPIAPAAALRETSVLFATAIAAFVLREKIGPLHWCAACLAFLGIVSIRVF